MFGAEVTDAFHVAVGWDPNARLALDRFDHERADERVLERLLQRAEIVVRDATEAGHKGAVALETERISGRGDGGQRAAPEVFAREHDLRLVLWDLLFAVAPFTGNLARRVVRLDARVHRQHFLVAEKFGDFFSVLAEHVAVEGARLVVQDGALFTQCFYNFRMTVAEVVGGVSA